MLSLGSSMHWSEALESLTREKDVNADALLEYFKPLTDWLKEENTKYQSSL
jgi:peptidyl-dipeptidase A